MKHLSAEKIAAALAPVIAKAVAEALGNLEPETRPEAELLTVFEFAEKTGMGISDVREQVRAGSIAHIRTGRAGRNIRIPRVEIEAHIKRRLVQK
jgi:excisionase family DNA binding protein